MSERPISAPGRPSLEERAADTLNAVMGGLILLAATAFCLLQFADTLWRAGDILRASPADQLRAIVFGVGSLALGLRCLWWLVSLVRKALGRTSAAGSDR